MAHIPNDLRDSLITAFRTRVCEKMEIIPFEHQAKWWLASDGLELGEQADDGIALQLPDGNVRRHAVFPRHGGRARVLADLGAYKVGKSFGAGVWTTGFAAVPHGRVSLVGAEYDMCAPEFEYLCDALLSDRGMGLSYASYQNRPRDGRMWLELQNGCRFEAKSWERADSLKGKEIDAYVFCEAYQLPGIEVYTANKQNLVARDGYALFPTTPDRPWLQVLHDAAHSGSPEFVEWHCTCGVPRSVNRFTFSQQDQDQADPDKGKLMTREQFAIAYEGKLGQYVGRVFNYQRGQRIFTPESHPFLFRHIQPGDVLGPSHVRVPDGWLVEGAGDTGAHTSGLLVAVSPDGDTFVLAEFPNYHYVNTELELDEQTSIPAWATQIKTAMNDFGVRGLWADKNSQFKRELLNYGIVLLGASTGLEARTEITRTYLQQGKLWLAPWLRILPYELELAQWPEESTVTGKFQRIKRNDHTLDCLEHILARHPRGSVITKDPFGSWAASMGYQKKQSYGNTHLGAQ